MSSQEWPAKAAIDAYCPTCGARPGEGCRSTFGRRLPVAPHRPRVARAEGTLAKPESPSSRGYRTVPIPKTVNQEIARRSKGLCEAGTPACPDGPHRGSQRHHRLLRSLGGQHDAENLLFVCNTAHTWIHGHPALSYTRGWLVRSGVGDHHPEEGSP